MDATVQFEDINHSKKADEFMKDLYIGEFKMDGEDESWEEYVRRSILLTFPKELHKESTLDFV